MPIPSAQNNKLAIDKSRLKELETQGWTMRFIAGEPRLGEGIELYRAAGFDVRLEPLNTEMSCNACSAEDAEGECRVCFNGHEDRYKLIFTRPCMPGKKEDEELF
jgi:hypothetical protein